MKSFFEILETRAREAGSLLCVGLDPHPDDLRMPNAQGVLDFCQRLIDATAETAAAFKPNSAFFEAFGAQGMAVLQQVIAAVPRGIPVILDAKRADIASTGEAYARAAFQVLRASAVTVNPYLGEDAVLPFLSDPEHGVFLLCRTSNPGAADLQDLWVQDPPQEIPSQGRKVYEVVAQMARQWNRNGNLGLVVGATYPEELKRVRLLAPDLWILAPGVGVQGGDLTAVLRSGLRPDGLGLLIPVSRAISRAEDPKRAALEMREAINKERSNWYTVGDSVRKPVLSPSTPSPLLPSGEGDEEHLHAPRPFPWKGKGSGDEGEKTAGRLFSNAHATNIQNEIDSEQENSSPRSAVGGHQLELADALLDIGCVKFGQFTLRSGIQSPIYLDLRLLVSFPQVLAKVASAYLPVLHGLAFDRLAALPYAALPIATAISLQGGWPMLYPRKEAKAYGTKADIEGAYSPGERVVVIDDLATTGGSKFEAIEKLTSTGLEVSDVVVLIDRQSGAAEGLAQAGVRLHAVLRLSEMLDHWERSGRVEAEQISAVRSFLNL